MLTMLALLAAALPVHGQQKGVAYLEMDLRNRAPIVTDRPDLIDVPIRPGSVAKIATLAAALESGVIDGRTGIMCSGEVSVAGHRLTCTHPNLHRPLGPAEALAHSCNGYFAAVAARLPRSALDRALDRLGLPPSDPEQPVSAAALGVEGLRASPRRLLGMMARLAADPGSLGWRASTLAIVREGLRGAARFGTGSALSDRGISAMAKTGTTLVGGVSQGLVVGATPAQSPTTAFVLLASGASGADAASLAAERLGNADAPAATRAAPIRVGVALQDGGYTVRNLPIEEYVAGVVAGEAAEASPAAALEALAIVVRTYALANRERHRADGFDLCDLTHCQVLRSPTRATSRATLATARRVLLDGGVPANVFYTASCGGHSERPSAVWPGAADRTFLPARADAACDGLPVWSSELKPADLVRALRAGGFKGDSLRDLRVTRRAASGRAAWLQLDGFTPPEISGEDLRTLVGRTLGWQHLRSTLFDLRRTGSGFRMEGRGAGHGVGLCVIGSSRRAARGDTADAILARYFPGLSISRDEAATTAARSALVVSLPESDRSRHDVVRGVAVPALDALANRLAVAPPAGIKLRFHPTVESYERTTGKPWFTAGATHGTVVDFIPLDALEARRLLDSTIAHELVHILTAPILAGRPLFVLEGVASYFSDESAAFGRKPIVVSGSCPPDGEFTHPASRDALKDAYARAVACVSRQIEMGKSWRDLK